MVHILVGCETALSQGRYRWCHDKVICVLGDIFELERQKKHQTSMCRGLPAQSVWKMLTALGIAGRES